MRSSTLYRLVCAWPALHIFLLTLLCALVAWYVMPLASQAWLLQESGLIEAPTAGLFGLLALIGLLWRPPHSSRISWLAVCILCAAAGAREMDWHSRWTGKSIFKVSYYLDAAPWAHKILALLALLLVFASAIYLVWKYALQLWQGLLHSNPFARTVATLFFTLVFSKILDRSVNLLIEDFGVAVAPATAMLVKMMEETCELSLPLMVALAVWQHWRQHQTTP